MKRSYILLSSLFVGINVGTIPQLAGITTSQRQYIRSTMSPFIRSMPQDFYVSYTIMEEDNLQKLFGIYAQSLAQEYLFIKLTLQNFSDRNFVVDTDQIGLPLVSKPNVLVMLDKIKKDKSVQMATTSILHTFFGNFPRPMWTPRGIEGGGNLWDYLVVRWRTSDLGLPKITTDIALGGSIVGGPAGKIMLAFGFSPAVIFGTIAAKAYQLYKMQSNIAKIIEEQLLEAHEKVLIRPGVTKNFLLVIKA